MSKFDLMVGVRVVPGAEVRAAPKLSLEVIEAGSHVPPTRCPTPITHARCRSPYRNESVSAKKRMLFGHEFWFVRRIETVQTQHMVSALASPVATAAIHPRGSHCGKR